MVLHTNVEFFQGYIIGITKNIQLEYSTSSHHLSHQLGMNCLGFQKKNTELCTREKILSYNTISKGLKILQNFHGLFESS